MAADSTQEIKSWLETRITALYNAPDDTAFLSAFESTYAPEPRFQGAIVNSEKEEREQHMEALRRVRAGCARPPDVQFGEVTVKSDDQVTIVKGSFTVHRTLKIRIRAGPAERERKVQFEARIEQDPAFASQGGNMAEADTTGTDTLRITHYTETFEDKQVPFTIHPHPAAHIAETASGA